MNMATKNDIFKEKLPEYLSSDKQRKSEILNAVCEVSGLTRKGAIKRFRRLQLRPASWSGRGGRPVTYTKDVDAALYDIWSASNYLCGELLHGAIASYINSLIQANEWPHSDEATGKLRAMSRSTVKRRCTAWREKHAIGRGKSSTKPSALKTIIPIFKGPWEDLPPGNGQLDTVAHCGESLAGDFVYTLCYIDTATYWCIPQAQWNKGQEATRASLSHVRQQLPVPLLHAHPDTGSEFINWHLKEWCDEVGVELSCSEPGKKNDNMYVEERNGHVVRKYVGYTRLDCPAVLPLLQQLYAVLTVYLNHWQPVRRTLSKERVGSKYIRTYEPVARTPYTRMQEHPVVSDEVKAQLKAEHATTNPLALKREIDRLTALLMKTQRGYGA